MDKLNSKNGAFGISQYTFTGRRKSLMALKLFHTTCKSALYRFLVYDILFLRYYNIRA